MSFRAYARAVGDGWPGQGAGLILVEEPVSTHLLARRIVQEYSAENTWSPSADVLAWRQTGGVGRDGRAWSSPPGLGVYASLIRPLTPAESSPATQALPLVVATALCKAVNRYLGGRCQVKWPNDLVVEGRKLAGILIDTTSRGQDEGIAVISFGVNHGAMPESVATAMEIEAPGAVAMPELAGRLVAAVDAALESGASVDEIVDQYRALSLHREGDTLRCRAGGVEIEGQFQGFDSNGFLRLRVDGEERLLAAGEIRSDG
ncbi:MAG: biotin--[acetyl-CoA-carboxylase] ligase [Acidobacteriota bacterium]